MDAFKIELKKEWELLIQRDTKVGFEKKKSLLHSESIAIERDALYANVASKI